MKKYIALLIELLLYFLLFAYKKVIDFDILSHLIMLILIYINWSYYFNKSKKLKYDKMQLLFLIIINLAISFFVSGKVLFLSNNIVSISFSSILFYLLTNIFTIQFVHNVYYFLDNATIIDNKNHDNSKKFAIRVFLITFIFWFIICLIYYPGNITSDTSDMISQALGFQSINNAHPAFYTIIVKLLLSIWNNIFIIVLSNSLFFSIIITYIYKYFYEQKVNEKLLYISLIVFILLENNIAMISMAWKDIPYTISLLWLTFEVYKIAKYKDNYFKKNFNIFLLCTSLLLTFFIRHNGIVPYLTVIIYLLYLLFKLKLKLKIIISIIISILSILFVRGPVYSYYNVQESNIMTIGPSSFAIKGLASLVYYDKEMDIEDQEVLYSIISKEDYKKYYSPYTMDNYSYSNIGWYEGIEKVGTSKIYELYIKYLFKYPNVIIRDRLDNSNLSWSYATPKDGFNTKNSIGVEYPEWVDNFKGFERNEGNKYIPKSTIFRKAISLYQKVTSKIVISDIIIWRFGFALSILLILFYLAVRRKLFVIPAFLPTIFSILFWFAFMMHQDYRYMWFAFVNTYFLTLFTLLDKKRKQ